MYRSGKRYTQKLKDRGCRAGSFEQLYFLADSGVEYKPGHTSLVWVYKEENMVATWKFCNREEIWR
jgi:hypothetical protein